MKCRTLFTGLFCCLAFAGHAAAQNAVGYCEPAPAIKSEIKQLPKYNEDEMSFKAYQAKRLAALQELVKKYPDDYHVRKSYLAARRADESTERPALREEYRARAEAQPNDPVAAYFYASLLVGTQTKEAIERLNKIVAQSPDFTPAYLELSQIYGYPAFRDAAKVREHLKSWAAKCPAVSDNVSALARSNDPELMREALQRLRARLAAATEPEDIALYDDAWSLEFKLKPVPEHAAVRTQIAEEVKLLRERKLETKEWLAALQAGYKTTGDKDGKRWAEDEQMRLFPTAAATRRMVRQRWDEAHPRPKPNEPEKKTAYNLALIKATDDWIKQWPAEVSFRSARFFAMQELEDCAATDFEAAAEGFLAAQEKNETVFYIPPVQLMVAGQYAKRGLAGDRIPALVLKGLAEMERRDKRNEPSDLLPREDGFDSAGNMRYVRWQAWPLLAEAYAKLKQPDKARAALAEMAEALVKEKPDEKAKQSLKNSHIYNQITYWTATAKVSEAETRKLDALSAFQTALALRPKTDAPKSGKKDELLDHTQRLFKELGGTDEGWKAMLARNEVSKSMVEAAKPGAWDAKNTTMPDFALTDMLGKKWQLADLKGKTTFVNLWATWCGPCLQELPYVQKLHEQMKDRKDVLILTLNIDEEVGLVEPFMKENKYTFTAIPAQAYAQSLGVYSIPRNWVVGADGVLQLEGIGFGGDGEDWMKKATEMIEKVKGGGKP